MSAFDAVSLQSSVGWGHGASPSTALEAWVQCCEGNSPHREQALCFWPAPPCPPIQGLPASRALTDSYWFTLSDLRTASQGKGWD